MSNKKVQMPTGVTKFSDMNLSSVHTTTSDFMQFNIAKTIPVVPRATYEIKHNHFSRLVPMPKPTMGKAEMHEKWFFVPYRTVFPAFDDFYNDTVHIPTDGSNGYIPQNMPAIKESTLVQMFCDSAFSDKAPGEKSDFVVINFASSIEDSYRNFTPLGRWVYKLLCSCGYKIYFDFESTFLHAAHPLLCAMKVYIDWFFPSQYITSSRAQSLFKVLNYDNADVPFDDFFAQLDLEELFGSFYYVSYDNDYFTGAWDNPVSPNDDTYSQNVTIEDITSSGGSNVEYNTDGTPYLNISDGGQITQYGMNLLRSLTDYTRRNQLVGARVIDRYLAHWGVKLPNEVLRRSYYLGGYNGALSFGEVYSTADSGDGSPLGDYAGRGIGRSSGSIALSAQKEFGMLVCISTKVPVAMYYQGQDRETMKLSRLDFFTEEFDNLGVQALGTREVFVPMDASKYNPVTDWNELVWGFVPRYGEYKRSADMLTGDFVLESVNETLDAYHLFRDLSTKFDGGDALSTKKHDFGFVNGVDAYQFNRVFYVTDDSIEHFRDDHMFFIKCSFPGSSMYDSYEFNDEDKADKVAVDINGSKAN